MLSSNWELRKLFLLDKLTRLRSYIEEKEIERWKSILKHIQESLEQP